MRCRSASWSMPAAPGASVSSMWRRMAGCGSRSDQRVQHRADVAGARMVPSSNCGLARTRCSRRSPLAARRCAALFIDYGPAEAAFGDTLQAVRRHAYADPLAEPGTADLTAHVQFAALGGEGPRTPALPPMVPMTQAEFLGRLGLAERAARLMSANPDACRRDRGGRPAADVARPAWAGSSRRWRCARPPFRRSCPSARTCAMPSPLLAAGLSDACGHRARLLHAPRRRVARHLRQPQLRRRIKGRSRCGAREPRARRLASGCAGDRLRLPGARHRPRVSFTRRGLPASARRRTRW